MQRGLNYHWAAIAGSVCFTKLKFSVIIKLSFFSCSNISLFAVSLVMFVLPSVLPCINITCNFGNIKSLAFHIISRRKFHMLQESQGIYHTQITFSLSYNKARKEHRGLRLNELGSGSSSPGLSSDRGGHCVVLQVNTVCSELYHHSLPRNATTRESNLSIG